MLKKYLPTESQRFEEVQRELLKEEEQLECLKDQTFSYQLWQRIPKCNLKIQELKPNYYQATLKLIEDYYLVEEPLLQYLNVKEDVNSIQSIKTRVLKKLKDSTSLIALNEGNFLEVAGVLITVEVTKSCFNSVMSRENLVFGSGHKKYVQLTSSLIDDIDLYEKCNCLSILRIYALCIKPKYRHIGLGMSLFQTAIYVAQSLRIPYIMGIFTDSCMQVLAEKIGMKEIKSVKYSEWKNSDGDLLYANLKVDNKNCALMAGQVHFPSPIPLARQSVKFSKKKKKKDKKKKGKNKKDKKKKDKKKMDKSKKKKK